MNPAYSRQSWKHFTAAVAAMGLSGWAGLSWSQSTAPAPRIIQVQAEARPLAPLRAPQTLNTQRPAQPLAQQPAQQYAPAQAPQSEIQRELQKLYEKNGRAMPEMVDVRAAQSATSPPAAPSAAQSPVYQPPAGTSATQYTPPQTPVAAQPVSAPKKKGLLNKLFGKKEAETPTQPPVEPGYTPPTRMAQQPQIVPPPVSLPATPGPNYGQIFENGAVVAQPPQAFTPPAVASAVQPMVQPESVPETLPAITAEAAPSDPNGFEAPLFVDTPNGVEPYDPLPALDLNTPLKAPVDDTVNLGQAAEFPVATVPEVPAEPAASAASQDPSDPFSDSSLFPEEAAAPLETPVIEESIAPESLEPQSTAEPLAQTPVEENPVQQPSEPVAEENPYSGLSLSDDPAEATAVARPAAPLPPPETADTPSNTTAMAPEPLPASQNLGSNTDEEPPLTFNPQESLPATGLRPIPRNAAERTLAKREMIAARKSLPGLKGFCPVALRDHRDLVDARSEFRVVYNNKTYYLGSSEAVQTFLGDPAKYAPASRGSDVIQLSVTGEESEGSLEHAVWYKGRLYMFTSAETMDTFVAAPSSHATLD
ncbi:MAG: hypothetical protein DWH91_08500 [Planctomycetota bacterium]|nr:MAG: hypothetical protein DWH91_08500 [Planctomycetota bacterium]